VKAVQGFLNPIALIDLVLYRIDVLNFREAKWKKAVHDWHTG